MAQMRASSFETGSSFGSLAAVWLGMRSWNTCSAEMLLSLSISVGSKKERVWTWMISISMYLHYLPVGVCMTSSSRVMHLPPALVILALAASVNLSAATVSLGTSSILSSSVTVETTTTVLSLFSPRCLTSLVRERGGLLTLEETSLRRTVFVNLESVLLDKNLKSFTRRWW